MDDLALGGEVPLLPVRAVTLSHINIRVVLTLGTLELSMLRSQYSLTASKKIDNMIIKKALSTSGLSLVLATCRHRLVTGLLISAAVPGACCVVTCTHHTCHT